MDMLSKKEAMMEPRLEKLLTRVEVTDGCWLWTGSLTDGYGRIYFDGKFYLAHRVAYELFVGPIPPGLTLDHLCRVRHCVRPEHLEAVTMRVNILRGIGTGARNAKKTHCPQGHPYDEVNTYRHGGRHCRICVAANQRRYKERRRGTDN